MYHILQPPYPPRVPNFNQSRSTASRFQVAGHFETNAPNGPKLTLSFKRSNMPTYIHVVQLHPNSKITLRFALQPAVFEFTNHFETSALNNPKMTLNTKRSKITARAYHNYTHVSNFAPFRSTASQFRVTRHFETSE